MIWFFLAGFIAGFVGEYMFGRWCYNHVTVIKMEDADDKCTDRDQGDMD